MKNKLIYPIVVVVFAAACGGDGEDGKAVAGQQYETVQEGSAAGVTSSIAGPGETLPPITNTNADTTSAFALNPNAVPMAPQSGAVAGTMPPPSQPVYSGAGGGVSPSYNPSSRPASPAPRQTYVPPPMTSSTRPAPQQPPAPAENTAPAPQQPAEPAEEPAPATDTSATTNTAPPPPAQTNTAPPPSEKPKQEEPQEEEAEEPAEEPPPPPPPAV